MPSKCASRRGFGAAAVLAATLTSTAVCGAASPDNRAVAKQHLSQAEELKKRGQLTEACVQLEEVERLDSKLPTLVELAECDQQAGKLVEAQAAWTLARDRAKHDEKPQSRARAESQLAVVEKRIAHLTLQLASAPAGTSVLRDDVALDATTLGSALPTNPGNHVIVVKLAGHDDAKYAVKLADGDAQTLPIAVGPTTAPGAAPLPPPPAPSLPLLPASPTVVAAPTTPVAPAPTGWWSSEHELGVIAGAVGLLAVGGGSALCVVASHSGKMVDERFALGGISLAGGGVLFISGIALLAAGPSAESAQHARMPVSPTLFVARGGTVLGAAGDF